MTCDSLECPNRGIPEESTRPVARSAARPSSAGLIYPREAATRVGMAKVTGGRMTSLQVRVTERVLTDLNTLASTWDTTRSEALRRAIREAAKEAARFGR